MNTGVPNADAHVHFDFSTLSARDRYKLLIGTIIPRPIAFVTTVDERGRPNAAPFSFFNCLSADPAIVAIGVENHADMRFKDTAHNIRMTEEFTVNIVDDPMLGAMHFWRPCEMSADRRGAGFARMSALYDFGGGKIPRNHPGSCARLLRARRRGQSDQQTRRSAKNGRDRPPRRSWLFAHPRSVRPPNHVCIRMGDANRLTLCRPVETSVGPSES
jgi:hypothetical protein